MNSVLDFVEVGNWIDDKLCDVIVNRYKDVEWEPHKWYDSNNDHKFGRDNELKVLYPQETDFKEIYEFYMSVRKAVDHYVIKHNLVGSIENFSDFRFNRYDTGCDIKKHTDLIRRGPDDGIPVISVVGCFNDDYTGGEFVMFENTVITLKKGDIVIFPSTFFYPHFVKPVISGTRYSFVTWGR